MWIETQSQNLINLDHYHTIKCEEGKIQAYRIDEAYPVVVYAGTDAEAKFTALSRILIKTRF
jgi:hypothetical protein